MDDIEFGEGPIGNVWTFYTHCSECQEALLDAMMKAKMQGFIRVERITMMQDGHIKFDEDARTASAKIAGEVFDNLVDSVLPDLKNVDPSSLGDED